METKDGKTQHPSKPNEVTGGEDSATMDKAAEISADVKKKAEELTEETLSEAKRKTQHFADKQKGAAAQQLGGVAHAIGAAADDLDAQDRDTMAYYTRKASENIERISNAVSENSVDEIVGSVEDFARRQPVAFLGGAVLAGFALARFAKSSSERRRNQGSNETAQAATGPLETGGHTTPSFTTQSSGSEMESS